MRPDDCAPLRPGTVRGTALLALAGAMLLAAAPLASANDDAHRLAERFAGASGTADAKVPAPSAAPPPAAVRDPAADAQSRAKALEAARAARKARQEAETRRREAERRAAEMKADEARMLERVRAELEQLHAEERAAQAAEQAAAETLTAMGPHPSETTAPAPATVSAAASGAPEVAEPVAAASPPAAPVLAAPADAAPSARTGADLAALEAQREQEGRRLEEKLAKARQSRLGGGESAATGTATADEPAETASAEPPADQVSKPVSGAVAATDGAAAVSSVVFADTVTILLALEPGSTGIRRHNSTADPVICIGPDCYVSEGAGLTARKVTRGQVAGPALTLGLRAGACNQRTACVFRNVPLPAGTAMLQPIDLRLLRHDRREEVRIAADASCKLAGGALACQTLVRGPDWIAWVVPETIAAQAGADKLETALAQKLGGQRTAVLRPAR